MEGMQRQRPSTRIVHFALVKAAALGHQLLLLYDGAITAAYVDGNTGAAAVARSLAANLLDAATAR